jgi:hypothetical protein
MTELIEYIMIIRHLKPEEVRERLIAYQKDLIRKYPNDQDLGKEIRKL